MSDKCRIRKHVTRLPVYSLLRARPPSLVALAHPLCSILATCELLALHGGRLCSMSPISSTVNLLPLARVWRQLLKVVVQNDGERWVTVNELDKFGGLARAVQ